MINRRSLLLAGVAASLPSAILAQAAPERILLWPGTPPGGGGPSGSVDENRRGAVSNIAAPTIAVFAPVKPNGAAMLVAAGGGYRRIEQALEADPAARWLTSIGITAFVLTYRLPGEGWAVGPLAPLQDAQRAIRSIRSAAARYHIDSSRVGALGFSAGGHLAGMEATRSDFQAYTPIDAVDGQSARPDFLGLIYPVVTLEPPYDHTSTRRQLVGNHATPDQLAEWSVETHVTKTAPPMFLVQAQDDPISDPANTKILAEACRRAGVPVERHLFLNGGHGFGLGRAGTDTAEWPDLFRTWLTGLGVLR